MSDDIQWPSGFGLKDLVSYGSAGLVVLDTSSNTVIKKPIDEESARFIDIERRIYERLTERGGHDGLLFYYGVVENGIRLEYAPNHDLKTFINKRKPDDQHNTRLRWIFQIAEALRFIHDAGIVHGDLTSANIFLDSHFHAKVADFAGSSLDRSPVLVESPAAYQCPEPTSSVKGDLFAFGSLAYDIMTGQEPYHGSDGDDIRVLFANKKFPNVKPLGSLGRVIENCWHGKYSGCDGLLRDIKAYRDSTSLPYESNYIAPIVLGIAAVMTTVFLFSRESARNWFPVRG